MSLTFDELLSLTVNFQAQNGHRIKGDGSQRESAYSYEKKMR